MGDQPVARHRAQGLHYGRKEKLIMCWWLAAPALIVNFFCALLAALARDPPTFLLGWCGASLAAYGFYLYADTGRMPMGYRSLAMQLRWDMTHEHTTYQPGQKLPALIDIAHQYDTTHTTVRRAMQVLAKEGLVDIIHGRGTYFVGGDSAPSLPGGSVRDRIEWHLIDVAKRAIKGDPMPSSKALSIAYRASPELIRSVQGDLAQRGLIRPNSAGEYIRA